MNYRNSNGWGAFFEHWGFLLTVLLAVVAFRILFFFSSLAGMQWIYFLGATTVLLLSGASLIMYAKLPIYRSRRFFTFGSKSIPENLVRHYRWGWRIFLFGVVLSLCLLLSNP